MKNMIKSILYVVLLMNPLSAFSTVIEGINYELNEDKTATVKRLDGQYYSGSVVVPESVSYKGTTYIVTSIGYAAFNCCYNLTSVELPNTLKSIENGAFANCSKLTSIFIPKSVQSIGDAVFHSCTALETIVVDGENPVYDSRDNCNAIIETATNTLISGTNTIPQGIRVLADWCFSGRKMRSIEIPYGVEIIGQGAFEYCENLEEVALPSSIFWLRGFNNSGIKKISFYGNIVKFESNTFMNCHNLEEINVIPISEYDGYLSIDGVFYCYCDFFGNVCLLAFPGAKKSIEFPDNLVSIFQSAFEGADQIKHLVLPNGLKEIGKYAFSGASLLESIELPEEMDLIGEGAFADCDTLRSINIPIKLGIIEPHTFENCSSLESVTIPEGLKEIRANAFYNTGLKSIDIPESVEVIEDCVFLSCEDLKDVTVHWENPIQIYEETFSDYGKETVYYTEKYMKRLHVPKGFGNNYLNAEFWNRFNVIIEDVTNDMEIPGIDTNKQDMMIYNTNGYQLVAPANGINIINGKKYLVEP